MQLALNVTFVGMFVVFLSLIILSIIIDVSGRVFSAKNSKNGVNPGNSETARDNPEDLKNEANGIADNVPDNGKIVAAITAAITAYLGSGFKNNIRVRSIRRVPQNTPVWNVAGRMEHIAGKQ